MKKIIIIFLLLFFIINNITQNTYCKNPVNRKIKDKYLGLANDDIVTELELKRFIKKSELIFRIKYPDKYNLSFFNSIFTSKILSKNGKMETRKFLKDEKIREIYINFLRKKRLNNVNFTEEVIKQKLYIYEVIQFLIDNHYLEKLLKNNYLKDLRASDQEIDYYMHQYNKKNKVFVKPPMEYYSIIYFLNRSDLNKNIQNKFKNIIAKIKEKKVKKSVLKFIKHQKIKIKRTKLKSDDKRKKLKKIFLKIKNKNITGPLYIKKKIMMLRIFKKNVVLDRIGLRYRVGSKFFYKNSQKKDAIRLTEIFGYKAVLSKMGLKVNKNIKKLNRLNIDHTKNLVSVKAHHEEEIFNINNLYSKNKSRILETKTNVHLICPIEKEYSKNLDVTKPIVETVRLYKFKKYRKETYRLCKRTGLYKIVYDN